MSRTFTNFACCFLLFSLDISTTKFLEFKSSDPENDLLKVAIHDENDESRGIGTFNISEVLGHPKGLGVMEMSGGRGT